MFMFIDVPIGLGVVKGNAAGILNKTESFKRNIQHFKPGVFFIQESKTRRKNQIKIHDYVIFEQIRKESGGGGLLTAVHKNIEPVSVCDEVSDDEILVVETKLNDKKVRMINAYGPQEDSPEDTKKSFFNKLDEQVKRAKLAGALVCMELDANSKLGSKIIPWDPHTMGFYWILWKLRAPTFNYSSRTTSQAVRDVKIDMQLP